MRAALYATAKCGRSCRFRVKTGKAQCEQMFSAVHPTTDIAKILRHVRFVPLPDSCIAAIASYSITSSALTSSAGDVIRHRRRLFFPRALVEHAQHRERSCLNPGLDGRLRHRPDQGRVVARQLRTFALAGGSDALRLVDADTEEHRGHASVDELRIIFAGRDNGLNLSPNAAFSTLQPRRDH